MDGMQGDTSQPGAAAELERKLRVDLAACYRLIAHRGLDDQLATHISVRLPGEGTAMAVYNDVAYHDYEGFATNRQEREHLQRDDIWSFGRFPPGEEPEIQNEVFEGLEAFRGHNPFLEEDFPNILATNVGIKCRGWRGARTNPVQEISVNNFHRQLAEFVSRE
jgi:hypothetical protein